MKDHHILYASRPCGCMALAMTIDHDTDRAGIVNIKRVAKRHGYKLERISSEEYKARSRECPEHKAIRVRVAREKAGVLWD